MSSHLEVEIKLAMPGPQEAEGRLLRTGALAARPRVFEDNHVLDFPDGRLRQRKVMLRVRLEAGGALLTVKERHDGPAGYKTRSEQETRLQDGDGLLSALTAVGLITVYRYQKYRTVYRLGSVMATVDETPLGCFIELEGDPDSIDAAAEKLGCGRGDYIDISYRKLQIRRLAEAGVDVEPVSLLFEGEAGR